jgi:hypothetical protein
MVQFGPCEVAGEETAIRFDVWIERGHPIRISRGMRIYAVCVQPNDTGMVLSLPNKVWFIS